MSTVLGWGYVLIGIALCVDVYRNSTADEFRICHNSRSIKVPWWVPGSNWVWDRNFWGVMLVPFWIVLLWPYLLFIRPRIGQAR